MNRDKNREIKLSENVYTEFPVPKALSGIADSFFSFTLKPFNKKIFNINFLPSHQTSLIIYKISGKQPSIFFHGPSLKTIGLKTNADLYMFSAGLIPFAALRYFKLDHGLLLHNFIKLNNVINKEVYSQFRRKVNLCKSDSDHLETVSEFLNFAGKTSEHAEDEIELLCRMISETSGEKKLDEYYAQLSVNKRSLQRKFKKAVGFTPKEFARLVRVQQASSDLVKQGFKHFDIMYKYGYYDQSHYIKEFRKFMGSSPKDFEQSQKRIDFKFIEK
jgi:AraC-like DNA-binding protein